MKKFLLISLMLCSSLASVATHTKGGWMYYEYLGRGTVNPTNYRYKIVLKVYMICDASSGQLDESVNFSFFDGQNDSWIRDVTVRLSENPRISNCTLSSCNPCISNIPSICYMIATYETEVELEARPAGYTVAYQRCCRISGILNVNNSNSVGDTWFTKIPGTTALASGPQNSSPQFVANDTAIVCAENFFTFNFTATDKEGDSLTYEFAPAFSGGSSGNPAPITSAPPPFSSVPYKYPFTSTQPLGTGVSINKSTGVVSGMAPSSGVYVLTVKANEFRDGILIGSSQKSLHLQVADCFPIQATLNPTYITCDGFSLTFRNETPNSNIKAYRWEFDDPASGALNVSESANPTHVFTDTGVYRIKLFVNRGLTCSDSTISEVKVYPGFFPGFTRTGQCVNSPVSFRDTSKTKYGTVNSWRWDFGDPAETGDTSLAQHPSYVYKKAGTYTVQLTVTNELGCFKVATEKITIIDNPVVKVAFRDTAYCGNDTLQLAATANVTGTYNWQPGPHILRSNTANPLVFPKSNTTYIVTFDAGGCRDTDTVFVQPKFDFAVTTSAVPTSICEGDTTVLSAVANYPVTDFTWSPASSVADLSNGTTQAFPKTNTTYTVSARWGNNCIATHQTAIAVKTLIKTNAGADAYVCENGTGVGLQATGGQNFSWSPATGLSNAQIANPVANPASTTTYTVTSFTPGCQTPTTDTITITFRETPEIFMPRDTLICSIDTLLLPVSAPLANRYTWSPAYNISNTAVASPSVSPDRPTTYVLRIADAFNCTNTDSVFVDVKTSVTLRAGNDTTICLGDEITLQPQSDALSYFWSPAATLSQQDTKNPRATPVQNTVYTVIANIGKCEAVDQVTVRTVPYPVANAGADVGICADSSVTLNATGGSNYVWTPADFLTSSGGASTVAKPPHDMQYVVSVSDNKGCPKSVNDTVFIKVFPKVVANAGRDTVVVINQPLQLNGSGGDLYTWMPPLGLSNPAIANPVATLRDNQRYVLTVSNAAGCSSSDTISVVVYKVDAGMYVPNAFTPNGDGLNDIFRPIALGIRTFISFNVYDRYGNRVYSTQAINAGWDGTYQGKPLDQDVFVWTVEGIDYENNKISKRGSVMLLR